MVALSRQNVSFSKSMPSFHSNPSRIMVKTLMNYHFPPFRGAL